MKQKLVLIGNGMAGVRAIEELFKHNTTDDENSNNAGSDLYDITIIGAEPHPNYNRIMLSPVLASEQTIDDIILNSLEWYEENNITLITGDAATEISRVKKSVITESGKEFPYDRLLIATGSNPFILPVPGADKEGVLGFRDIYDVDTMVQASKDYKKAVVIGGGLLGLEAANGLMKQGMDVTVVHLLDSLMEMQLDKPASALLKASLESRGMTFLMEAQTAELVGDKRVTSVKFADGSEIDADLVVMAVGIRPNIELAQKAGIHCERGIVVNDTMQTYDPQIYSVGECVQHRGSCYGLVAPLFEQAKVAANHLAHLGSTYYIGSMTSTKLKVTGIDLFSAGDFNEEEGDEILQFQDEAGGVYKKLVLKDNVIKGAVMFGDTMDGTWYFSMMRDATNIADFRKTILFGQHDLGDAGHGEGDRVMALPDDAEICGCNGVNKGDIVMAISRDGLFTLDEVKAHTKAAASCGSCVGLVESILSSTVGDGYEESAGKKPICACTDSSHDDVIAAIKNAELKTMPAVREFLNWKTPDGCASCRPALNYYLLARWPAEYKDDAQSRFINERVHGNIQKDGTYSVIPRIFGGVTTAKELMDLGRIAEKWEVPTVKYTGGQRIDLLGIKKQDLPGIWGDLNDAGFISGHAYGKSLRTVKTCVGSEWCRFGTQDSTGLGIKLEEMTWGSWMQHKYKIAVSGCPRNCAEATIKDFGVVCVDSGYELHVGGNGGIKVRVTDYLCKVDTEEEVMEYVAAFTQLYREEAHYLERTAPWIERVGFTHVKNVILGDEEERKALHERFKFSQKFAQIDPWKARVDGEQAHEFAPLKITA